MLNQALMAPRSIVVVGASENIQKPGGKIVKNLLDSGFTGQLLAVNPNRPTIHGATVYADVQSLPSPIDLAVLAVPAAACPGAVNLLAAQKGTRAFIIISAGFAEESEQGKILQAKIVESVNKAGACLIGPNCIGVITPGHSSLFTLPVPVPTPQGADLITASGAVAVFLLETGLKMGLRFNHIFSVGNAAQTSVEDVLEHLDATYDPVTQARVKLLYLESIKDPQKLLVHALSLHRKGCRIAAIKAGTSNAGMRAALSHTGSMAGDDRAVDALFQKAGIIRCHGREQLAHVAAVLLSAPQMDRNIAIITQAGGPAVIMTDLLEKSGFSVPKLSGPIAQQLLAQLHHGAAVGNPIDLLATGTAQQLQAAIDACQNGFAQIGTLVIIYGSPGLTSVDDVFQTIHQNMVRGGKPILAVMPSCVNAQNEMERFRLQGHPVFTDEAALANAMATIANAPLVDDGARETLLPPHAAKIRQLLSHCPNGFLSPDNSREILSTIGIPIVDEITATTPVDINRAIDRFGFPLVAKVIGPLHKSDLGGVVTQINSPRALADAYNQLVRIEGCTGVTVQPQIKGHELFIGAKKMGEYGHLIMFGLGGIFVETLRDVASGLAPLSHREITEMLKKLHAFPLFEGVRNQRGINMEAFVSIIEKVSQLVVCCPQIDELDLNPLIAAPNGIFVVDARLSVKT